MGRISYKLISDSILAQYGLLNYEIIIEGNLERTTIFKNARNEPVVYAFVFFIPEYSKELNNIHREIISGKLIGETINAFGYQYVRDIRASNVFSVIYDNIQWTDAYCTLSDIQVGFNDKVEHYCTICEVYNPSFIIEKSLEDWVNDADMIKKILISKGFIC